MMRLPRANLRKKEKRKKKKEKRKKEKNRFFWSGEPIVIDE